jgi:site-specific DNA recombinase
MERYAGRGEWTGGGLPFGYRLDAERRFLVPDTSEAPIVAEVFRRYAERLEGSASIAKWLIERGCRTKRGKPFNVPAVLTILRNRAYVGEVFFRGRHYPAPHEALVDVALFERAGEILRERGEDASLRRSNQSDYLLTGLVKCARCGKRYVGAAAHGNGGRYAYYVCFSRQRYGRKACEADRLPAGELEEAILAQLERVLAQEEMVREAIAEACSELDRERPRREAELRRIEAEARRTDDALNRYFAAFEAGTMTERDCAGRIAELSRRLRGLEARRAELAVDEGEAPEPLGKEELRVLQANVREVIETGDPPARKALLQALVEEIRVVSRAEIYPSFSLPAVRPPSGSARPRGFEPLAFFHRALVTSPG